MAKIPDISSTNARASVEAGKIGALASMSKIEQHEQNEQNESFKVILRKALLLEHGQVQACT